APAAHAALRALTAPLAPGASPHCTHAVRRSAALVAEHGTDCWWTLPAQELLPPSLRASGRRYRPSRDTLDVWFDSGASWAAVLGTRGLSVPADLVLEGSDQHRGWFQSSLLTRCTRCRPQLRLH
ncbi:MAG: class I tRNA ligase family protein, partial [Erythrobacter sp.]